ncbi:hypothetical protein WR25_22447 [Diploscapter pachys]|uniref:VWFA domain-containing protein n=1 Tax=Diploscapter pachys TaxID=2018661 RepID=A0A2A2KDK9_9BILA|nr:hypothetical protein WR25_22447 [Diploscapter pachys]
MLRRRKRVSFKKDDDGNFVDEQNRVLPTNDQGQAVFVEPAVTTLKPRLEIVDKETGELLPTQEDGTVLDIHGQPISTDSSGHPLSKSGEPLPTTNDGKYVSVDEVHTTARVLPTDDQSQPLPEVIGPDNSPLSTNSDGDYVSPDGTIIRKNEDGQFVDQDNNILPTNDQGQAIFVPSEASTPRPTYQVVDKDGNLLPTDPSTGEFIAPDGRVIATDPSSGKPLGPDSSPLPTRDQDQFIFITETQTTPSVITTDDSGKKIYPVVRPDGTPLNRDSSGRYLTDEGAQIEIGDEDRPLGPDNQPLQKNEQGRYVYPITGPDGRPIPTHPVTKLPIYPIVDQDGNLLPTDPSSGVHIDSEQRPIPTDSSGIPLGEDSSPLPTDSLHRYISISESLTTPSSVTTDESGHVIFPIVRQDGSLLSTDSTGRYITDDGTVIELNEDNIPLGPDNELLNKNDKDQFIYPAIGYDGKPIPTHPETKLPIYPIVDQDGNLLPTDPSSGVHLNSEQRPFSTDSSGKPLGENSLPLPTDDQNRFIAPYSLYTTPVWATDSYGVPIYDIIRPDGSLLAKDESGQFIGIDGTIIPRNEQGYPLSKDGSVLPSASPGRFIYSEVYPTDVNNRRVYPVVDHYGTFLSTATTGGVIDSRGQYLPTDSSGKPLDGKGAVLPTDSSTRYVLSPSRRPSPHCFVSSHIDLLFVVDASNNIKVLDYRIMKDLLKSFLVDHVNMAQNGVRVGFVKYGDTAEVPISLGDYDHEDELLAKMSETRRIKGRPNLGLALKEAGGEIAISGIDKIPRFVIVVKNGLAKDDLEDAAKSLVKDANTTVFVIEAGDDESYAQSQKLTGDDKIVRIRQWRGADSEALGPIADQICRLSPSTSDAAYKWPIKKKMRPVSRKCDTIDYPADVIIMLDSSENFTPEEFSEMKESVAALVDDGFDLAPDVARIGFIVYSDKVAVPVALGHYDDKIELMEKILESEKINDGVSIILYGLNAAKQQFQLHGRENVTRIVIMMTNGKNRGNAAPAAEDLRDTYGVEMFAVAVSANQEGLTTLRRIIGNEFSDRLFEVKTPFEIDDEASSISKVLCGYSTPAEGGVTPTELHKTTKRDVDAVSWSRTTRALQPALCADGIRRPFQVNLLIDVTGRSAPSDFRLTLDHIVSFFQERFAHDQQIMRINVATVSSNKVVEVHPSLTAESVENALNNIVQLQDDMNSAKLGVGIDALVDASKDNYIAGSYKIMIVVSADGTSSDEAMPAAEYAIGDFSFSIIGLSIRNPASDLLTNMAGGSPTRVIHLADWTSPNELFNSWVAYAMCDYVAASTTKKLTTPTKATSAASRISTKPPTAFDPANVDIVPLSPTSISVSWTCCTNSKSNYTIIYTHDTSISRDKWLHKEATCRDSFGFSIEDLPTEHEYTVCVVTTTKAGNKTALEMDDNCATIYIDKSNCLIIIKS